MKPGLLGNGWEFRGTKQCHATESPGFRAPFFGSSDLSQHGHGNNLLNLAKCQSVPFGNQLHGKLEFSNHVVWCLFFQAKMWCWRVFRGTPLPDGTKHCTVPKNRRRHWRSERTSRPQDRPVQWEDRCSPVLTCPSATLFFLPFLFNICDSSLYISEDILYIMIYNIIYSSIYCIS